ncbi:DUF72 domain-containing protein [Nitrospira sp. KM1]|uniref:DUF72 domain-containing protein n=1 Tax=Nitrospira sp. KM1 TaxID=1936990 RepID=UPI00351A54B5
MKVGRDSFIIVPITKADSARIPSQNMLCDDGQTHGGAPLFHTVGIDRFFYHPANVVQLTHYASQVPVHFRLCSKVWEELTIPSYVNLPRYGSKAGTRNRVSSMRVRLSDLVLERPKKV